MPKTGKEKGEETRRLIIAIDGPAGSGKSTTAKLLAERLGYHYLDTGAMYRAVTLKVIREGISRGEKDRVAELVDRTRIELRYVGGKMRVFLDGEDVTELIRSPEVDREISWVSQIPQVRRRMVQLQREMARGGGVIAEGRDMGTVVFPDADLKIYLTATAEERGKRRWLELRKRGIQLTLEEVVDEIKRRDRMDISRKISPLRKAKDAVLLNTTDLSVRDQVEAIARLVRRIVRKGKHSDMVRQRT